MTRGLLQFGGNTVKVWVDDSGEGVTASSNRPLSTLKFREFAGKYESEVLPQMKPASQSSVKSVLGRLNETFGARRLQDICSEEIQKFITGSAYSPKTIKNQVGVMRMAWNKARAWGYVKHDPFEFLSYPRAPLAEARTLSAEEVRAAVRKTDEPFKTMLWILAETGIRGGELAALYKSDVDSVGSTMKIARSAFRKQIQTPKTANAVREIAISGRLAQHLSSLVGSGSTEPSRARDSWDSPVADPTVPSSLRLPANSHLSSFCGSVERHARGFLMVNTVSPETGRLLAGHKSGQLDRYGFGLSVGKESPRQESVQPDPQNLLFPMPDGRPWDNGEIVRRLKPVLGTGVGLHAFRHANASLMASLGVPEHIRRERLGHSSGNVTARYTHSSPEDHRRWAEEIGRACVGTENGLSAYAGGD